MDDPQDEEEARRPRTPADPGLATADADPAAGGDEPPGPAQATEPSAAPPQGWFLA